MSTVYTSLATPIGPLLVATGDVGVELIEFASPRHRAVRGTDWREGETALLRETCAQLLGYFAGERTEFDLPLAPRGTPFQLRVWHALADIPYASTQSYAGLATGLGKPTATRAVGAANGRNPLPIVLPCHRVIGANGSLTGFGGGLDVKRFLLDLEQAHAPAFALS